MRSALLLRCAPIVSETKVGQTKKARTFRSGLLYLVFWAAALSTIYHALCAWAIKHKALSAFHMRQAHGNKQKT